MDYCQIVNFSKKMKKNISQKFKYDNPDKADYFEIDDEYGNAINNREVYLITLLMFELYHLFIFVDICKHFRAYLTSVIFYIIIYTPFLNFICDL